jgi:hypothetical protein
MPEQQLAYFKVDMDEFSPEVMQQVLGRTISFETLNKEVLKKYREEKAR